MKFNLKEAHKYWKTPPVVNKPFTYMRGGSRSECLANLLDKYCDKEDSILELGCNVGRNLFVLQQHGFSRLWGVDINEAAIKENIVPTASFMVGSIEEIVKKIPDRNFDVVFSLAVLMHIPYESEWIFRHIARITNKFLLIIEKEDFINHPEEVQERCYERDYSIFNLFGFARIYKDTNITIRGYVTRLFKHE